MQNINAPAKSFISWLKKPIPLALTLLVICLLAGGIGFVFFHQSSPLNIFPFNTRTGVNTTTQATPSQSVQTTTAVTPSTTLTTQNGESTFTSNDNKLSFNFATQMNNGGQNTTITATESQNKITIYPSNAPSSYDMIEVFPKVASDTIQQSILKNVLAGYTSTDCPISTAYGLNPADIPANFQSASIRYNANNVYQQSGFPIDATKCPADFTAVNTARYFLIDTQHPNRLLFILNGIPILTGSNTNWVHTITLF